MAKKRMNILWGQKYGDVNNPKTRWNRVGTLLIDEEDGRMSIKMDTFPVSSEFNGWLSVMEPRDWDDKSQSSTTAENNNQSNSGANSDVDDRPIDLSEIPF